MIPLLIQAHQANASFGDFEAARYHQWRMASEFMNSVEIPHLGPILTQVSGDRILDLGSGSGAWTKVLHGLHPKAEIVGIDDSSPMVEYAQRYCPTSSFWVEDARTYRSPIGFDVVVGAMSCDYIGFRPLAQTLKANLNPSGEGIFWFLDPHRYPKLRGGRMKHWNVDGKVMSVAIADFSLFSATTELRNVGFIVRSQSVDFSLADGISRTLHILTCNQPPVGECKPSTIV